MNLVTPETAFTIGYIFVTDCIILIYPVCRGEIRKLTKVAKNSEKLALCGFRVTQSHWYQYQSKGHTQRFISWLCLVRFPSCDVARVKNRFSETRCLI